MGQRGDLREESIKAVRGRGEVRVSAHSGSHVMSFHQHRICPEDGLGANWLNQGNKSC